MGFLHKLWDETLAGPAPDSGLAKLRKCNSLTSRSTAPLAAADEVPVSRSITILRSHSISSGPGSTPTSPTARSSTPGSPFSPTTPGGDFKRLTRRKSNADALQRVEPKSPTGYDWIILSALDR